MATNIVIRKLEDKVFDDNVEAERRLNELGINSDVTSEVYKNLAEQVRDTCPCHCRWKKDKRLKVDIMYDFNENGTIDTYNSDGTFSSHYKSFKISGNGTGLGNINSNDTSCNLIQDCTLTEYSDIDETTGEGTVLCEDGYNTNGSYSFQISLDKDCKYYLFDFNPFIAGKKKLYNPDYPNASYPPYNCEAVVFNTFMNEYILTESHYVSAKDNIYPIGTMKLKYEKKQDYNEELTGGKYSRYIFNGVVNITASVSFEEETNTLNTINSLYSDLSENLK